MTKTRLDVISQAHREIGVLATDETATADQEGFAGDVLDSLFAELKEVHGMPFTWTLDATPDAAFLPLSLCLAAEIQNHYEIAKVRRTAAVARLRAYAFPDDRASRADYDSDGIVTDDEQDASDRAQFY